jgi:DNA polymerase-3 subunit alpha
LQFNSFQQLQDTLTSNTKKITLHLEIDKVDEELASFIDKLFKNHKGDHKVDMIFYETNDQIKLITSSQKFKINVEENLLRALDNYPVNYKLN